MPIVTKWIFFRPNRRVGRLSLATTFEYNQNFSVMKNMFIALVISAILSCSKEEVAMQRSYQINSKVELTISNKDGDDLLNPSNPDAFQSEEIKLYYLIGSEKILAKDFDPQLGGEGGIMLITETEPNRLRVFTYSHGDEGLVCEENDLKKGISIAYLDFGNGETDTIKVEWESKQGIYFVNKKAWYNGKLHQPAEKVFEVVKSL